MKLKLLLKRVYWIVRSQFGLDPRMTFRALMGIPKYISDYRRFRAGYEGPLRFLPCLQDWNEEAGAAKGEYFWQDLLVARMIYQAKPERHVDIGSRIDGFVGHLASFRNVEVFDIRPVTAQIPGVTFRQADLMQPEELPEAYCDSLSCLHALEHFGLGRYGDPIDPNGFERGLSNMSSLLAANGVFYLSIPVGQERVEFNGQRVSDPGKVVRLCETLGLTLTTLTVLKQNGEILEAETKETALSTVAAERYALGIFTFTKSERQS